MGCPKHFNPPSIWQGSAPSAPLGGEAVLVDGAVAGSLSSAGFGHSVGQALGFAWVRADCVLVGARITVPVLGVERSP